MTGVEILATEEVAVAFGFSCLLFSCVFCCIVLAGALVGCLIACSEGRAGFITSVLAAIVCAYIIAIPAAQEGGEPTAYETQYKVTISDEVSINEFLERYEIIDQEGKIYTVRERDGE